MLSFAFFSYTAVMSITPGPNNLMLAASGVNHGFRKTIPHMLGIVMGVCFILLVLTLTLGTFVRTFSAVRPFLTIVGCAYLLWLSWKTATAAGLKDVGERRPLGFWGAALFQGLNPKVWLTTVNTALLFVPRDLPLVQGLPLLLGATALVNGSCISVWAFAGDRMRRFLSNDRALKAFNFTMGSLMAITAGWLLVEEFGGPGPGISAWGQYSKMAFVSSP